MEIKLCKRCKKETPHSFKLRPDTVHAGELRCTRCNLFWGWKPKEITKDSNGEIVRKKASNYSPDKLKISACQLCLRPKEMLGTNEVLTVHHVIEIQDGGQDIIENIWVICSACHSLVHHMRTYHYRHFVEPTTSSNSIEEKVNDFNMEAPF